MKKGGQSIYLFFLISCIFTIINMEWLNNMLLVLLCSIIEGYIAAFVLSYLLIPVVSYVFKHFSKAHRYNTSINKFVFPRLQIFPDFSRMANMKRAQKAASGIVQAHSSSNDNPLSGFDNSAYPMLIVNKHGICMAANAAAQQQYGYSKEEFQVIYISALYTGTPVDATGTLCYHKKKNGEVFCVDTHFMNVTYKEHEAQLAICIDAKEKMYIEPKSATQPQLAY